MKKAIIAASLFGLLLSSSASSRPRPRLLQKLDANPSALLALEIAMKQLSKEKGRNAALMEFAAPDAIVFVPQKTTAAAWLKENKSLPLIDWDVYRVIMSCDGKTGVSTGAWKASDKRFGYFTTVWQRYEKKDGTGRWLWSLTHEDLLAKPLKAPDFIQTETASCKGKAPASITAPPEGVELKQGLSRDQSLSWTWQYRGDGSRSIEVKIWDGEKIVSRIKDEVAAP